MALIRMHLHNAPFERMKRGDKTVEARVNDVKRQCIAVGDMIEFELLEDSSEKLSKEVIRLTTFKDFDELYRSFPDAKDETAMKYYTERDIEKFGVVAIELQ